MTVDVILTAFFIETSHLVIFRTIARNMLLFWEEGGASYDCH